MRPGTENFNIEELSERSGISVRTIRFYMTEGLVPRPGARGKSAVYGEEHLSRLHLIRRLSEQRVPLAEIRERLAGLSLSDIRQLLRAEERHSAELRVAEQAPSAKEYVSALLRRSRRERPSFEERRDASADMDSAGPTPMDDLAEDSRAGPGSAAGGTAPLRDAALLPGDLSWPRLELAPGVELHVRADAEERSHRLIKRLLEQARRG